MTFYVCLPGKVGWQFDKISSFCPGGKATGVVGETKIIWVASLIAAFITVGGAWSSQWKQSLQAATYLPCGISRGTAGKERFFFSLSFFLAWQTSHWPRLRKQKPSEVSVDWQLVDKVMIKKKKLAMWLRAVALIPSLCLPASAFDISDAWWHHIWSTDRRSLNVAVFVIFDDILRFTPKTSKVKKP